MAISRLSLIKLLELVIVCTCIGIHYHSYNSTQDEGFLITGTYVGFLIVFAGQVIGYLVQAPVSKKIDIIYSLIGVCLFTACGGVLIDRYRNAASGEWKDKMLAKASLSIINAAILLIDAALTQRGG